MNAARVVALSVAAATGAWGMWSVLSWWRRRTVGMGDVREADPIARMLVVELGSRGTEAELAGMVQVTRNRQRAWGNPTAEEVVYSRVIGRSEFGSGCGRNQACQYNQRLDNAHTSSAYPRALSVAQRVLEGELVGPLGAGYRVFVHPNHPGFASPGGSRVLDPPTGRYLPAWAVSRRHGGLANAEPVDVGTTPTRFA